MRQLAAAVAGAATAVVGGLIVGEYPFTGLMPYVAGVLFGLVIAEVVVAVGRRRTALLGAVAAVCAGGGLAYAAWDDAGYGIHPIGVVAWVGVAIATAVAGGRAGLARWVVAQVRASSRQSASASTTSESGPPAGSKP